MNKSIYIFLLLFSNVLLAQLSNKHWLPPLHSRDELAIQDHHIYISTAETTPFLVTVKTGNGVPIAGSPFTVSRAVPAIINIGNGQPTSMFLDVVDVNIVKNDKGLILEGPKDFYVSFRMRASNHAETLISKGRPGIGTSFRLGSLPQGGELSLRNFVSSVMATEDNTTITLSDYDPGVEFVSGAGAITDDTQTFTLNQGETIVFSGYADNFSNWDGFIGALLTSTKPVAVNTGNAHGGVTAEGSDLTLDQIVSSSQIGTEYIFIEGKGLPEMESPLIIANEDNTEIYINGATLPATILNAGDYYLVPNSFYQGSAHQNIYLKSSKPVFAYQLLGGDANSATSGLNFIPPLSCFFQESVYLPSINKIGNTTYSADLMILANPNASISINGNPINTLLAQNVLGNTDWVTYRISGYSGNVNVVSSGPLAVGVFGFSGAAGFAGYYSGFGSAPQDTPVAVCSSSTTDLFEAIIGNPGPGGTWTVPAGGAPLNGNVFDPNVNIPGEYSYAFTKTCNSALTNISVKVIVSIEQGPNAGTNATKDSCIQDAPFDLFPLLGTGVTTGGTWSPTLFSGTSMFNPAVDSFGVYTYTIPATGACPELSSTVTINVYDLPTTTVITELKECDTNSDGNDSNGETTFILTQKINEIMNGQTDLNVTFHLLENDAISGSNAITTYTGISRTIYVRVKNTVTNCFFTTSFNVVVTALPTIDDDVTLSQCDDNTDAITDFNLTEANSLISVQNNLTFKYFTSQTNAINNISPITNDTSYNAANNSVVWSRIENENGCIRVSKVNLIVSATQVPSTFVPYLIEQCDDYIDASDPDNDGIDYFDLNLATNDPVNGILAVFPSSTNLIVTYYETQADALAETNPIDTTDPDGYRNITPNQQTIWVRIDSNLNNSCVGLGPYVTLRVNPLPDFDLIDFYMLCVEPGTGNGNYAIDATPQTSGNYTYVWTPTNPETTGGLENAVFNTSQAGVYKVLVTNTVTGCVREDETQVDISSAPQTVEAELVSEIFASGVSTIQAIVIGGFGDYEYSLDGIVWQDSPVFTNLPNGSYIIIARDKNGCGELPSNEVFTISFPNYFTPNADGYNDIWKIDGLTTEFEAKIYIFDRYGKLIKQINPYSGGWDGTFNGQLAPSTDYWFRIEYKEKGVSKEFRSHFTLKR